MTAPVTGQVEWKPGELDLRKREVVAAEKSGKLRSWVQVAQVLSVIVALISTIVASISARQNILTAKATSRESAYQAETDIQQSDEKQLLSIINRLDTGNFSTGSTRILLLQRGIENILSLPLDTSLARQEAYEDYATVLNGISVYIRSRKPKSMSNFGMGYGVPDPEEPPYDSNVTNTLVYLVALDNAVRKVAEGITTPNLDLSKDQLYGLYWIEDSFKGLDTDMEGADLRDGNLTGSNLDKVDLNGAYLQCANLSGADLERATLVGADLRGAYIGGADFRGANLKHAKTNGVIGFARGFRHRSSAKEYDPTRCRSNKSFWDNKPR